MDQSMDRAMNQDPIGVVVGPLSSWPTADLRDAYRLTAADVRRSILAGDDTDDIGACEEEAAMFADELIRRGEL